MAVNLIYDWSIARVFFANRMKWLKLNHVQVNLFEVGGNQGNWIMIPEIGAKLRQFLAANAIKRYGRLRMRQIRAQHAYAQIRPRLITSLSFDIISYGQAFFLSIVFHFQFCLCPYIFLCISWKTISKQAKKRAQVLDDWGLMILSVTRDNECLSWVSL